MVSDGAKYIEDMSNLLILNLNMSQVDHESKQVAAFIQDDQCRRI
jgi:hypothetical protein